MSIMSPRPNTTALAVERAIGELCKVALTQRGEIGPDDTVMEVRLTFHWEVLTPGAGRAQHIESTWTVPLTGGAS